MRIEFLTLFFAIIFYACDISKKNDYAQQPTITDYKVGEKWVWKYKGITKEGEVRSEGIDARAIVNSNKGLGITIGKDTIPLSEIVAQDDNDSPKYDWPLQVGKKWKYENNWVSQDGTTGSQSQIAEVLTYKDETVEAGTFMTYTIKYSGKTTNSRGYNADEEEIWLYAPSIKNFIKMIQSQGDFLYTEELIEYSRPR